ncbi:hypothetical protein BV22DRAFT_1025921, partial [Leucogyrophana mollusca]
TGPFKDMTGCPKCREPRYDQLVLAASNGKTLVPRQTTYTIPIGPQLQALWRTQEGAKNMRYRSQRTREILASLRQNGGRLSAYDDVYCGRELTNLRNSGVSPELSRCPELGR